MGQQDNTLVEQKVEVTDTGTGGGATVNIDGNMGYHAIPVAPGFNPAPQNQQEQGQQNDGPKEPPPPQNDNNAQ